MKIKSVCEWVPGTRNSLCDKLDTQLALSNEEVSCRDCIDVIEKQNKAHYKPLGWSRFYGYESCLMQQPGYYSRWLIALDEWHPNFNIGFVKASMCCSYDKSTWYVNVYGADDDSLVKGGLNYHQAYRLLHSLPILIDHQTLYDLGFEC